MWTSSTRCPHHPHVPHPGCPICSAWIHINAEHAKLTKEHERLQKEQEKVHLRAQQLDYDRQLFKIEKRQLKRTVQSFADHASSNNASVTSSSTTSRTDEQHDNSSSAQLTSLQEKAATDKAMWEAEMEKCKTVHQEEVQKLNDRLLVATEESQKEIVALQVKLQVQQEGRVQYEQQYTETQSKLQKVETERSVLETKLTELDKRTVLLTEQHNCALENQRERLRQELQHELDQAEQEYETQLQQLTQEKNKLVGQVREFQESDKAKEDELEEWQQRVATLEDDLEDVTEELQASKDTVRVLNQQLEETRVRSKEEREESDRIQAELQDKVKEMQTTSSSSSGGSTVDLHARIKSLQNQNIELKAEKEKLLAQGRRVDGNRDGPAVSQEEYEELKEKLHETEMHLNQNRERYEKQIMDLEDQIRSISATNGKAKNGVHNNNDKDKAESDNAEIKRLKGMVTQYEQMGNGFLEEKVQAEEDLLRAEEELRRAMTENDDLTAELNQLREDNGLLKMQEQLLTMQLKQAEFVANHDQEAREIQNMVQQNQERGQQVFGTDLQGLETQLENMARNLGQHIPSGPASQQQPQQGADDSVFPTTPEQPQQAMTQILGPYTPPPGHRHVKLFDYEKEFISGGEVRIQSGKYTGYLNENDMPHGRGFLRMDTGDIYGGEWSDGDRHGSGVYAWYEGDLYMGGWNHGKRHGMGVFVFSDGRVYGE